MQFDSRQSTYRVPVGGVKERQASYIGASHMGGAGPALRGLFGNVSVNPP